MFTIYGDFLVALSLVFNSTLQQEKKNIAPNMRDYQVLLNSFFFLNSKRKKAQNTLFHVKNNFLQK